MGSDDFVADQPYTGDFADPTIVADGGVYYAYATNTANLNLPVMTSTDLVTWVARTSYDDHWWHNDAMPRAASWATMQRINDRTVTRTWAPSAAKVGSRWVVAYSAPLNGVRPEKRCVAIASGDSPIGPFTDTSAAPIVCPSDQGAIDPQVYVAPVSPKVPRPPKELKGFARVELAPGETRKVIVDLDARAFSYWDAATHQWKADPGDYRILVGSSTADTPGEATVTLR